MDNIIITALNYYFDRLKPRDEANTIIFHDNQIIDLMPTVTVNGQLLKYNNIGIFQINTNTFTWAWHLNILKRNYIKTKQLLTYYVNNETETLQDAYIKRLLTSSTINDINSTTITTIISLATYLTKADFIVIQENKNILTFIGCYTIDD